MKAIDFVVRDDAGALQRGVVPVDGGTAVALTSGQEISLNLRQIDMMGQQRVGDDLVVVLADGRQITLQNYFNDTGAPNRLFISADGYLNEVTFVETTDGELVAQFGPTEQWGKWSPSDDLIYLGRTEVAGAEAAAEDNVSMLGAPLLAGAGFLGGGAAAAAAVVGGAALVGGGGGGGGGGGTDPYVPADPTIDGAATSTNIGGDDTSTHRFTVSGTGEPGDTVEVAAGGQVQTTTIAPDGSWSVEFAGGSFPVDGTAETSAVFSHAGGGTTTLTGPTFIIDTTPPEVAIISGVDSVGHVVNGAELSGGVVLEGTGEPGAALAVTIAGVTRNVTVADDGTWAATWQPGTLADGEYSTGVDLVATDAFGNSTTLADTLVVDTVAEVTLATATVETDGIINATEASDGVTLTGTAQPGSTVEVSFGGVTRDASVDAAGGWTATFPASDIPSGETDVAVMAVATDAAGNTATAEGTVAVDTLVNALGYTSTAGGDGTVNAAEAASGLVVTGVVEPGSSVVVALAGVSTAAVVAADGSWTASFGPGELPAGTYMADMVATAMDAAGNTSSVSQSVNVDTQASVLTLDGPVETDDVINGVEASDGVVLSGTADPGAVVTVALQGVSHQAVAGSDGVWQAFFAASDIAQGTYEAQISATTTDAAGNTATVSDTVQVDTRVDNLSIVDAIEGDNVVSEVERADGVVVTGTTEPGSTLSVSLGGATVQAIVDPLGNWQAPFAPAQVPQGEYTTSVSVTATDLAGNVATISETVRVDTLVNELTIDGPIAGDDVVNGAEAREGIALGGQVEPGSTVMVDFNGAVLAATVDAAGNWALDIPPSAIQGGEYDAAITVMATDAVGNTATISDTVRIDTRAPEGPVIASYTRDVDGIRGISTEMSEGDLSVAQVTADGSITGVDDTQVDIDVLGETNFRFETDVPDGSHLIVSSEDAAGNSVGTYVVLDDESANSTVDLGNAALGNYQIEAVELQFAEEANLTITEAQLLALSDGTDTLTIHGGSDDTVTIAGATRAGSTTVEGQTYDVYSLGTEGTVILDEDIAVNTGVV
ncbi:MAG: Ig-like domain-containing protein [Pseudomonadota bacterium]